MDWKRSVQSLPRRVTSSIFLLRIFARMRYPSNLSSCSHFSPLGTRLVNVASWGENSSGNVPLRAPVTFANSFAEIGARPFAFGLAAFFAAVDRFVFEFFAVLLAGDFLLPLRLLDQTASASSAISSRSRPEITLLGFRLVTSNFASGFAALRTLMCCLPGK